jgi:hypothetical protein
VILFLLLVSSSDLLYLLAKNLYGFTRVDEGPNRGSYRHRLFQKGRKDLLSSMNRQKNAQSENRSQVKSQDQEKTTTVKEFSAIPTPQAPPNPISPNPELEITRNEPKCIDFGIPEALHSMQDDTPTNLVSADAALSKPDGVSWRDSPSKSLSDWIIVVLHNDTFDKKSYNVNRRVLAVGARRSDYFARLFRNNATGSSNESVLVLGTAEVDVFPQLLDYLYSGTTRELNMRNAFPIFMLSKHLEIPSLRQVTLDFYRDSLSKENIGYFIQVANDFDDETLLLAAVEYCSKEIKSMDIPLAGKLKPHLLHQIILKCQSLPESLQCDGASTSLFVAESLHNHAKSLTRGQLLQITDPEILSSIDSVAAIKLLAVESNVCNRDHQPSSPDSFLRKRCVLSIARDWNRIRDEFEKNPALADAFKSVSSDMLFDILMQISGQKGQ